MLGLVGLIDPPRPEARAAVAECLAAGVRPVMITGDHPATALAIARDLGIAAGEGSEVLTGAELARLDDAALAAAVQRVSVYARMDPAQKIRIVQALQAQGQFVAMTGDGVNDAPALRSADIGVAMGKGGTDVAREASSLVLLDDNFATIVGAVREGRRIFDNIRKFIRYALTGNSGEIWVLFLAPLLGLPIPLLPIHILWVNLVTDGLPGLALAAEPAERGVMQRPPRPPAGKRVRPRPVAARLVGRVADRRVVPRRAGLGPGAGNGGPPTRIGRRWSSPCSRSRRWRTCWRSDPSATRCSRIGLASNRPLLAAVLLTLALQLATIYVPGLQPVFRTQPLSAAELALCFALAAVVFVAVEIEKAWRRAVRTRTLAKTMPPAH